MRNENVNYLHTSRVAVKGLCCPDRRMAMKALVKNTFLFDDDLWYIALNKSDDRCVPYTQIVIIKPHIEIIFII